MRDCSIALRGMMASGLLFFSVASNCAENSAAELRPLPMNPVPEGLKEIPFKDTNPEIQPTDAEKMQGFVLFTRPITEPIFPQTNPLPSERVSILSSFGTPGEFEPLNFAVYPLKKLDNLRVSVSEFRSEKNVIPMESLDLRLVTYRNILYPNYQSKESYRKMPELLEKVTVNTAPEKEPQRYWLKIKIPDNAKPGIYSGTANVTCDGLAKPVSIPISFRVLPFKLEKDPQKHYTAYNYDLNRSINDRYNTMQDIAKKKGREWIYKAAKNEYKAMVDYGFDTYPTIYVSYDNKTKSFYIIGGEHSMPDIAAAGMKGPVPAVWANSDSLYKAFTNKTMGKHHLIPEMPSEDFYKAITDALIKFEKERKEKGWPEFVYVPLDEVDASVKEFGAKVYKAFKDAGAKTYATKDPKSADAQDYAPYLDYWCSQPFSAPYEEVMSSKTHGYWCYPNHNSYEIKDPIVMCRGGRMTYGFGLWRSGYTLLIPWIWRSSVDYNYLKPGSAGGNPIAEDGSIIPAVYWECFREGIDDTKYLYTLQKAIVQRENSSDKECLKLVQDGKALVQEIWDNIQVQTKYLGNNVWDPREFDGYRWRMAEMIQSLQKYPAANNKETPSVIADYKAKSKALSSEDFLKKQQESGNLETVDLGADNYKNWKSVCTEAKISVSEKVKRNDNSKPLLFDVTVNYKVDGGGENGKYPVGWPRMRMDFNKGGIDLTQYDYITLWIMVDSERDEVSDDFSPFYISMTSDKIRNLYGKDIISEADQRVWIPVALSIKDMINTTNQADLWKSINGIQFGISENKYKDGTNLKFYLDNISLVKFKTPAISSTDMPTTLILPSKTMQFSAILMGTANAGKDKYTLYASLLDEKGLKTCETSTPDIEGNTNLSFDTSALKAGNYTMKLEIKDKTGKVYSSFEKKLNVVNGPLMEK